MDGKRLESQLAFLTEIDKMKNVFRMNVVIADRRRENDAEHSWHMAMIAVILSEYATKSVDMVRVLKMILVHDLVEIYAGDTFCYDAVANADKAEREETAAEKLFGMLPKEQGEEYKSLWREFDGMQTPDSAFAAAADRLQPFLLNYNTDGHTWRVGNVKKADLLKRQLPVKESMPEVYAVVEKMIDDCVKRGLLKE